MSLLSQKRTNNQKSNKLGFRMLFLASALAVAGCGTLQHENESMDRQLGASNFVGAAMAAEQRMGNSGNNPDALPAVQLKQRNVLDHLDAGKAWLLAGNMSRALNHFHAADESVGDIDRDGNIMRGVEQIGGALLGDSTMSYRPSPSESILINHYKALIYLRTGRNDRARVEFNRVSARTERAEFRFASELEKANTEAQQGGVTGFNTGGLMSTHFSEMAAWQTYPNFVLPATDYLQGLFLGIEGDREGSIHMMRRVVAMTDNPAAKADLAALQSGGICPQTNCLWIVAEHGLGPTLVEKRIDLPVQTSNGMVVLSMALPSLVSRTREVTPALQVTQASQQLTLHPLGNMDRTVQTEFSKRFPAMVGRSAAGAIVKAAVQEEVNKEHGALAGLFASVLSMGITNADVRMWRSMPGGFSAMRTTYEPGSTISIRSSTGEQTVQLLGNTPTILYIKQVAPNTKPVITQLIGERYDGEVRALSNL